MPIFIVKNVSFFVRAVPEGMLGGHHTQLKLAKNAKRGHHTKLKLDLLKGHMAWWVGGGLWWGDPNSVRVCNDTPPP